MDGKSTAVTVRNNVFTNTSGNILGKGTSFTPPYTLPIVEASKVKALVTASAGATLPATGCSSSSSNVAPTVSISSPTNNATFTAPASITISATATDSDGSIAKVEFYNGTTLLGSDNASPYSYTWSNVAAGSYSITAVATDNLGATTTSSAVTVVINAAPQKATLTKQGAGSSNQTIILGSAITNFSYAWANANTVTVTGMPAGIVVNINNSTKTVSISGTPTEIGVFSYAVTTVGGSPDSTRRGTIIVNSIVTGFELDESSQKPIISYHSNLGLFKLNNSDVVDIQIFNMNGVLVDEFLKVSDVSFGHNYMSGIYIVKVKGESYRIVKN